MPEAIELQRDEAVAVVRLNRPERRNALSPAVLEELAAGDRRPRRRRGSALHRDRRHRRGVRGRRRHQGDGGAVLPGGPRGVDDALLAARGGLPHAARGRGVRLRARRRVRAGAAVRPDRGLRDGRVRPAGDHARDHPGRRRHAAPRARDRQAAHDGAGADGPADRRQGGAAARLREQGRVQAHLARRGGRAGAT